VENKLESIFGPINDDDIKVIDDGINKFNVAIEAPLMK
jgi:hypothetical protein